MTVLTGGTAAVASETGQKIPESRNHRELRDEKRKDAEEDVWRSRDGVVGEGRTDCEEMRMRSRGPWWLRIPGSYQDRRAKEF